MSAYGIMLLVYPMVQVHRWYSDVKHVDGQVLTDEFLICRLLPVSIRLQGHPMVFGPEMVSGHLW